MPARLAPWTTPAGSRSSCRRARCFPRPRGHRASIARAQDSVDSGIPGAHRGRCADQLRLRRHGAVLRHRGLCPPDCTGRQPVRHADRAIAALLHGGQSEDGGIARRFFIGRVHRPGQRGDRMRRRATSSLPGLTRQSILLRKKMDARVKPAHDGSTTSAIVLRRREFITLLGGGAVAWPLAVRAQQAGNPARIGMVAIGSASNTYDASLVEAFRAGIRQAGRDEASIDLVWTKDDAEYAQAISDLVQRGASILVTAGTGASLAAKRQTSTIPIVFVAAGDPIGVGLVESLSHPGGNATGFS